MSTQVDPQHKTTKIFETIIIEYEEAYPDRFKIHLKCCLCDKMIEAAQDIRLREFARNVIEDDGVRCANCIIGIENIALSQRSDNYG